MSGRIRSPLKLDGLRRRYDSTGQRLSIGPARTRTIRGSNPMAYPARLRYSKQHQWIDVSGDIGTIGITDYAQSQLNEIVSVDLPKPGATLEAGQPLGSVESVKTVNEIDAPVSGVVVEVNRTLKNAPEKINSDPHGQGWLIKVRLKDRGEVNVLMDAAAYQAYVAVPGKDIAVRSASPRQESFKQADTPRKVIGVTG